MELIIVGAGGQGLVVAEIASSAHEAGSADVAVGFVDDRRELRGTSLFGLTILGGLDALAEMSHDAIVVAIGDNAVRRELSLRLESAGETIVTVRHPTACVAADASIGPGSMLSAGSIVIAGARLGRGVLLNTKASVDHQSVVGDFAHIACGATLGGNVVIGDGALIGLGASVMSDRRVGAGTIVGAGSLVAHDLLPNVVAMGVPARVVRGR